jgi:hypothetical protein
MTAGALATLLTLLMGYLYLVLTSWGETKDRLGGPFMVLTATLALVLAVSLVARRTPLRIHPDLIPDT